MNDYDEAKKLYYTINDLIPFALVFIVLAILLGAGVYILATYNDSLTTSPTAQAVVGQGVANLSTISTQTATIIVVVIAAIMLGIVMTVFYFRKMR